jgi:hypothetical protein
VERAPVVRPADSTILERCFGPGWIAIGDAAVSYDPLASRGLVGALSSGLEPPLVAAPEARLDAWQAELEASFATYRAERACLYVWRAWGRVSSRSTVGRGLHPARAPPGSVSCRPIATGGSSTRSSRSAGTPLDAGFSASDQKPRR